MDPLTIDFPVNGFPPDFSQFDRKVPQAYIRIPLGVIASTLEGQLAMTLEEAVKIYAVCARAENRSERTVEWVTGAARRLAAFVGGLSVEIGDIDTDLIRRFILSLDEQPAYTAHPFNKSLTRPVSPETKSCYVRGLKALFSRLLVEGYINDNPMAKIKTPKVPIREPEILSETEISRLFGVMDRRTPKGTGNRIAIAYLHYRSNISSGQRYQGFKEETVHRIARRIVIKCNRVISIGSILTYAIPGRSASNGVMGGRVNLIPDYPIAGQGAIAFWVMHGRVNLIPVYPIPGQGAITLGVMLGRVDLVPVYPIPGQGARTLGVMLGRIYTRHIILKFSYDRTTRY